jgi:hypothetical protein
MTDADLITLAILMREAQRAYFRDRITSKLTIAKEAEAKFDKAVLQRAAQERQPGLL